MPGADSENILPGAFEAQDAGFSTPVLVGEAEKIEPMLERLGLKDKTYRLVTTQPGEDVVQAAVDVIRRGEGDVLMRGNTQTRDFLMALLDKKNELRTDKRLVHIDLVSMPEYPKLIAIGDVTVTIEPDVQQKKQIIRSMTETLESVGYEKPNIALLSMVEEVDFHMKDTMEAQKLVRSHADTPIANCNLVGPIAYDLILSKEAARLKGYNEPLRGAGRQGVRQFWIHKERCRNSAPLFSCSQVIKGHFIQFSLLAEFLPAGKADGQQDHRGDVAQKQTDRLPGKAPIIIHGAARHQQGIQKREDGHASPGHLLSRF